MPRYTQANSDMISTTPRNTSGMLESALGSSQVYVRQHRDSFGAAYFAITTVQGEMLATFHSKTDAQQAVSDCLLSSVSLH